MVFSGPKARGGGAALGRFLDALVADRLDAVAQHQSRGLLHAPDSFQANLQLGGCPYAFGRGGDLEAFDADLLPVRIDAEHSAVAQGLLPEQRPHQAQQQDQEELSRNNKSITRIAATPLESEPHARLRAGNVAKPSRISFTTLSVAPVASTRRRARA